MKILNLISYVSEGLNQNIGDLFTALSLHRWLFEKKDQWKTVFFNFQKVNPQDFDLVILGGGGLYQPGHLHCLRQLTDWRKFKKQLAIVGLGLNLDNQQKINSKDKDFIKLLNQKAFVNSSRDLWTQSFLKKIAVKTILTGCPALFLSDFYQLPRKKEFFLGVNIALYHTQIYREKSKKIINFFQKIIKETKGKKIIICHCQEEKALLSSIFPAPCFYSVNPEEVFKTYSLCQLVIGMRGHSQIFSLAVNTPSLAISLNEKTLQPLKMTWPKSENLILHLDDNLSEVQQKIDYLLDHYQEIKRRQKQLKERLKKNFLLVIRKIKERKK